MVGIKRNFFVIFVTNKLSRDKFSKQLFFSHLHIHIHVITIYSIQLLLCRHASLHRDPTNAPNFCPWKLNFPQMSLNPNDSNFDDYAKRDKNFHSEF